MQRNEASESFPGGFPHSKVLEPQSLRRRTVLTVGFIGSNQLMASECHRSCLLLTCCLACRCSVAEPQPGQLHVLRLLSFRWLEQRQEVLLTGEAVYIGSSRLWRLPRGTMFDCKKDPAKEP